MNSIKRFENTSIINGLHRVEQRKPFYDNKIIDRIYSISDSYKVNYKLYSAMLTI